MGLGPVHDLGPAIVAWGGTVVSEIFEEVRWKLEGVSEDVFEAVYGATPVDGVFLGYSVCEVTVPQTRVLLATLATLLPGGTNSGGASGAVETKVSGSGSEVGRSMYDNGRPLFVKPISDGVAIGNGKWLRLEHTYPVPNYDVVFDLKTQRVFGLTFKAYPDTTTKQLWSMGTVATGTSY